MNHSASDVSGPPELTYCFTSSAALYLLIIYEVNYEFIIIIISVAFISHSQYSQV